MSPEITQTVICWNFKPDKAIPTVEGDTKMTFQALAACVAPLPDNVTVWWKTNREPKLWLKDNHSLKARQKNKPHQPQSSSLWPKSTHNEDWFMATGCVRVDYTYMELSVIHYSRQTNKPSAVSMS